MSDNTALWNRLGRTDPKHTSKFQRSGGFKGTAIKPIYSYLKVTEEFGPCGSKWGINEPTFQVVHAGDEILVYCTVSIWWLRHENTVFGVGGDKVVAKFSSGLRSDDEAFKKAFTDAVTNAMKSIGVGADVHMGRFDDSKYVESLRENPHVTRASDLHDGPVSADIPDVPADKMKVKDARPQFAELVKEMQRIQDPEELAEWGAEQAETINSFPGEWPQMFRGEYTKHKQAISNGKAANQENGLGV